MLKNLSQLTTAIMITTIIAVSFTNAMANYNIKTAIGKINAKYSMSNPLISADGKIMFYSLDQKNDPIEEYYTYDEYESRDRYDSDIYYSINENGVWSEPIFISELNTKNDEGIDAISPDGNTIYFVSFKFGWEIDGGPIYKADLRNNKFTNIMGLGGYINGFFYYGQDVKYLRNGNFKYTKTICGVSISADGNEMYFSTDVNRIYGEKDIWYSKLENGTWSYPKNLGPRINKINASNINPYIAYDNKTLFYAHDAPKNDKKTDIYFTVKENNSWARPENVGNLINTPDLECNINIPVLGNNIFFYRFDGIKSEIVVKEIPNDIKWLPSYALMMGKISDIETKKMVDADLEIYNESLGLLSYKTWNNSTDGNYVIVLQNGGKYRIKVTAEGYEDLVVEYDLTGNKGKVNILKDIKMKPIKTQEETIVVEEQEENTLSRFEEYDMPELKTYPNPVVSVISMDLGKFESGTKITITNLLGEEVYYEENIALAGRTYSIGVSTLTPGIYIIQIINGDSIRQAKFVKE